MYNFYWSDKKLKFYVAYKYAINYYMLNLYKAQQMAGLCSFLAGVKCTCCKIYIIKIQVTMHVNIKLYITILYYLIYYLKLYFTRNRH